MNVEGIGRVPPTRIIEVVPESDIERARQRAIRQAVHNRYATSNSRYKRGLKQIVQWDYGEDNAPVLRGAAAGTALGLGGEFAFAQYINCSLGAEVAVVDLNDKKGGDRGIDFWIYGCGIQIKARGYGESVSLIKRFDADGRWTQSMADMFVCCEYRPEIKPRDVTLLGWQSLAFVMKKRSVPAVNGDHYNVEIFDKELLPMDHLVSILKAKKELGQWR